MNFTSTYKEKYVPSKSNNYTVTAFIFNGDTVDGLLGKPMIWIYRYRFTLVRCRLFQPDIVEEVLCYGDELKYKLTFDVSLIYSSLTF